MKIVTNYRPRISRMSLQAFAERHDLTLTIGERTPDFGSAMRFYASFYGLELRDGCLLLSPCGNGATPLAAVQDLAEELSGKTGVLRASHPQPRELGRIPELFVPENMNLEET